MDDIYFGHQCAYYYAAAGGSFVMCVSQRLRGVDGFSVLGYFFPALMQNGFIRILDVGLVAVIGAFVAVLMYVPASPKEAVLAGVSWASAVDLVPHQSKGGRHEAKG